MAKAKSKAKKVSSNTQAATVFKPDLKRVKSMAHSAIEKIKSAGVVMRDIILEWKGERPETLEAMKEAIKLECKVWLKDEGKKINPQSIYNYQSDLVAACNGWQVYAGMTDAKRKAFDQKEKEMTGYHSLVTFLRNTKKGKTTDRPVPNAAKKMKSAWKNHAKEQMKKAKDMLRYAPTENLLALQDFTAELIAARKKGGEEGANVRKMLKRAA